MKKPIIFKGLGKFYYLGKEFESQMEKINEITKNNNMKNFKLEDLKPGMRVETRDGVIYIVSFLSDHTIIDSEGGYLEVNNFNKKFKEILGQSKFDIMAIYSAPKYPRLAFNFKEKGDIIWKRTEEIPELTMDEAIEKMGFEFKIVK